jgi:hypothetical protein
LEETATQENSPLVQKVKNKNDMQQKNYTLGAK